MSLLDDPNWKFCLKGDRQTKVAMITELSSYLTVLSQSSKVSETFAQYLFDLAFFRRRVLAGNFSFFFPFCICLSFISILSCSTTTPTFCVEGLTVAFCNKHQENLSDSNANSMVLHRVGRRFATRRKSQWVYLQALKKSLLL